MSDPESGHTLGTANGQQAETKGAITRARVRVTSARPPKLSRRLYDIQAVADYLGTSSWTVREMIWRGDLPCVRIGRRQYLDIRDVDRFIEQAKT
jgi:excisionase family DNA binding protein